MVNNQLGSKETVSGPNKQSLSTQKYEASNMEKKLQSQTPSIDALSAKQQSKATTNTKMMGPSTEQAISVNDRIISSDDPSSRKTSSSSNGSNSTSDSSSSFSSHNLKTLPENPDALSKSKPTHVSPSTIVNDSTSDKKSLFWQDDPGQLLNAWLGELDSLQKVITFAFLHEIHLIHHIIPFLPFLSSNKNIMS